MLPCEAEGGSLTVVDEGERYLVVVDGEVVATVEEFLATAISDLPHILIRSQSEEMLDVRAARPRRLRRLLDGFEDGTTAGFVLWMRVAACSSTRRRTRATTCARAIRAARSPT